MNTRRILLAVAPLAVVVAAAACSDEQKRSLGEQDVRDSLHSSVERALDEQGSTVDDGGLQCTSSIGADGSVGGACTGTTDGGDAIAGAYSGTADLDAETCSADLTVSVGETAMPARSGVDCFAS